MIPHTEKTKFTPDISPVIDLAFEYNQALCLKDLSTIYEWINYGCDIEMDILPTMQAVIKRRPPFKPKIGTFSYFSNPIKESFAKRTVVAEKMRPPTQAEKDESRAKNIRWHKERGLTTTRVGLQDFDWLERYEQKHGAV